MDQHRTLFDIKSKIVKFLRSIRGEILQRLLLLWVVQYWSPEGRAMSAPIVSLNFSTLGTRWRWIESCCVSSLNCSHCITKVYYMMMRKGYRWLFWCRLQQVLSNFHPLLKHAHCSGDCHWQLCECCHRSHRQDWLSRISHQVLQDKTNLMNKLYWFVLRVQNLTGKTCAFHKVIVTIQCQNHCSLIVLISTFAFTSWFIQISTRASKSFSFTHSLWTWIIIHQMTPFLTIISL